MNLELPQFSELSVDYGQADELILLAKQCASKLAAAHDPTLIKRSILELQQGLLCWESRSTWHKLSQAAVVPKSLVQEAADLDTANIREEALAIFYSALLNSPFEANSESLQDLDLWRQAQIWQRCEGRVGLELLREERKLVRKLQSLTVDWPWQEARFASTAEQVQVSARTYPETYLLDLKGKVGERERCFLALLKLRREIASKAGFSDYRAYYYFRHNRADLTLKQEYAFISLLEKYFLPLLAEVKRLRAQRFSPNELSLAAHLQLMPAREPCLHTTASELPSALASSFRRITGNDDSFFCTLLERGYVSCALSHYQKLGSAALLLPSVPAAFLALPLRSDNLIQDYFAQGGRALADISAMLNYFVLGSFPQDDYAREIAAYCLLCLSSSELSQYYPGKSKLSLELALSKELLLMPERMAKHSFCTYAYANKNLTVEDLNEFWLTAQGEYLPELEQLVPEILPLNKTWHFCLHNHAACFGELPRLLALVSVFAEQPLRKHNAQLKSKLNSLLLSNPSAYWENRLLASGFQSPLKEETLKSAAFSLCDFLAL